MAENVEPKTLTLDQTAALGRAIEILQEAFPGQSPIDIIKNYLLTHILGPLPIHSKLKNGYAISNVSLAAVAASMLCYGNDPESGETLILIIERKEVNEISGLHYFGLLGGYLNLDYVRDTEDFPADTSRGEQPSDAAIGEGYEESKSGYGSSLVKMTQDRLSLVKGGVNYRVKIPVAYFGHVAELNTTEISAIKQHMIDMQDETYRLNSIHHTEDEIYGLHLLTISGAKKLTADQFFHPDTWQVFQIGLREIINLPYTNFEIPNFLPLRNAQKTAECG